MEDKKILTLLKVEYFCKVLPAVLAQVRADNKIGKFIKQINSDKLFIHCINQKKLLRSIH